MKLTVVPTEPRPAPADPAQRVQMARWLRVVADAVEGGDSLHFTQGDLEWDIEPINALVLVMVDADGLPYPVWLGWGGRDRKAAEDAMHDVSGAISMSWWREGPELIEDLRSRARMRERHELQQLEEQERLARERPFLCDCGYRSVSERGLAQHQRKAWQHR